MYIYIYILLLFCFSLVSMIIERAVCVQTALPVQCYCTRQTISIGTLLTARLYHISS